MTWPLPTIPNPYGPKGNTGPAGPAGPPGPPGPTSVGASFGERIPADVTIPTDAAFHAIAGFFFAAAAGNRVQLSAAICFYTGAALDTQIQSRWTIDGVPIPGAGQVQYAPASQFATLAALDFTPPQDGAPHAIGLEVAATFNPAIVRAGSVVLAREGGP